jgi:hypothetical protein
MVLQAEGSMRKVRERNPLLQIFNVSLQIVAVTATISQIKITGP